MVHLESRWRDENRRQPGSVRNDAGRAQRNVEGFPDAGSQQAGWRIDQRGLEPGRGLGHGFMTQFERLMMNRHEGECPGLASHGDGLFRAAMRFDPRVVGPDWHQHQIDRVSGLFELGECVGVRGVAGKDHSLPMAFDEVPIVAPVIVAHHARSPMGDFQGRETNLAARG